VLIDTRVYTANSKLSMAGTYENRVEHISEPDAQNPALVTLTVRCLLISICFSMRGIVLISLEAVIEAVRTICISNFILREKGIEVADPIFSGARALIDIINKLNKPVDCDFIH
jgi:hypothetical protein